MISWLKLNKNFLRAVAVFVGAMVGVGIFGMPFAFAKAGFGIGLAFLIPLVFVTLLTSFMYGEVVLRTEAKHQLTGYTKKYLGNSFQRLMFFSAVLTSYAGLLAYIIIAGDFLNTLLSGFVYAQLSTYSVVFFIVVSLLVLRGLKTVSWIELTFTGLYAIVIFLIFGVGLFKIDFNNFASYTVQYAYLPYGVLLFAFGGLLAIPIQREILQGHERKLWPAIATSVVIVAILYFVFTFTVVGVSGDVTSPDAISGLFESLGLKITLLGALFGISAITTSFLMLASGMIEIFNFDFNIPRVKAWALVVFPPLILYLGGIRTFVDVVSLAGAVALGIENIVIIFLYARAKHRGDRVPEYSLHIPTPVLYLLIAMFTIGMAFSIFYR